MDFLQGIGRVALGSRLRRLGEVFTADAAQIYQMYQVEIQAKWFPVFCLLSQQGECSITSMAKSIGCSHPAVSQAVKEMRKAGLIETSKSASDARVNTVRLSESGRALIPRLELQMQDVRETVESLLGQMQHDLWNAIEEMEFLLEQKSLFARVAAQRKQRESQQVRIVEYSDQYHEDFKRLNYEWIERYFKLEPADRESLDKPQERIILPGGAILLAKDETGVVGTCALMKKEPGVFELVKMAVTPRAQGKSIGWLLGRAALEKAASLGAEKVLVESNTKLKPAINLYYKLGFQKVVRTPSPYERCNIQMEIILSGNGN